MWTFLAALTLMSAWAQSPDLPSAQDPAPEEDAAPADKAAPAEKAASTDDDAPASAPAPAETAPAAPKEVFGPAPPPPPPPSTPSSADEAAATRLLGMAGSTYKAGDHPAAKGMLEKLYKEYPGTEAQLMSYELLRMLSIVGRPAPQDWEAGIERWFTAKPDIQIDEGVVLVIFWEVWCPHCTRELPGWQQRYKALASQGLKLMAVTDITRDATPEQVAAFVKEHGLTFPIAKGDGTLSDAAAVKSIPAAVAYRDGVAIFRGSPTLITDAMVSEWLHSP